MRHSILFLVAIIILWSLPHSASAVEVTAVDKSILVMEDAARAGDDAVLERVQADLVASGSAEAFYKLGVFFMARPTVHYLRRADYANAVKYFEALLALDARGEADEKWNNRARKQLADLYYLGEGVKQDQEKALALLQRAIKLGSGEATYRYGTMLERGIGDAPANPVQAAKMYRYALRDRYGPAAFALVSLYRRSLVEQPKPTSLADMQALGLSLLLQKVKEGDPEAAYSLARLYELGEDVPADPVQALKWYEVAMKANKAEAFRGAARIHGKGQGVERDTAKAAALTEKAAEMGSLSAAMALGKAIQHDPGYYITTSDEVALTWLKRASAVGESNAVKLMANHYLMQGDVAQALDYLEDSAAGGNGGSMLNLYKLYSDGTQVPADPVKANQYLQQAMSAPRLALADRVKIGKLLMDPLDARYDPKRGVEFLSGAAEAGHKPSIVQLAKFYSNKRSTYYDPEQAFLWHGKAAADGAMNSMLWVAEAYATGVGVKKSNAKARVYFEQALQRVKTGDAQILTRIGTAYKLGYGTERNIFEALKWFERAAKLGEPNAKIEFARVVIWDTVPGYTYLDAIRLMREAAAQGESSAYLELGKLYANGMGDEVDDTTAFYYFTKAAQAEINEAYYYLGLMTMGGRGTVKDMEQAKQYLMRAASGGQAAASLTLGVLWQEGAFGSVNQAQAITYFTRAANAGVPEAHYYMALAYLNGNGVGQSRERGLEELAKAAKTGHIPAKQLYTSMVEAK